MSGRADAIRALTGLVNERGMDVFEDPQVFDLVKAGFHPEAELRVKDGPFGTHLYVGPEGWRQMQRDWADAWKTISYDITEIAEAGDTVVAVVDYSGTGVVGGTPVRTSFAWISEFRDERVVRWTVQRDIEGALALVRSGSEES